MKDKLICSRCDNKLSNKDCYCGKCMRETFDLPFGFIKSNGLLLDYEKYVDNYLRDRWVNKPKREK